MIRNFMVCLAVATFPLFNCKYMDIISKTKHPININEKAITPQNVTTALQKNSSFIIQKNETVVKQELLETNRRPKIRQVSAEVPVISTLSLADDMNAEQTFYLSPLMGYPFPMMNKYYPRYFPYTYPGYQGYPFFG